MVGVDRLLHSISISTIQWIQIQINNDFNNLVDNISSQRCPGAPGASRTQLHESWDMSSFEEFGSLGELEDRRQYEVYYDEDQRPL